MFKVYSRNEEDIIALLRHVNGCKIVKEGAASEPALEMVIIKGTCSACPHFESAREDFGRNQFLRWGTCTKLDAHVNEHKPQCSLRKEESVGEDKSFYVA